MSSLIAEIRGGKLPQALWTKRPEAAQALRPESNGPGSALDYNWLKRHMAAKADFSTANKEDGQKAEFVELIAQLPD